MVKDDAYISTAVPADVEAVAQRLDEESERLSGHSFDQGSAGAGIAANVAAEAATLIRAQAAQLAEAKAASRDEIKGSYLNGRADAEAESARLREALEKALADVEYKPGDHPIVPHKYAAFRDRIRTALNGGKDG